jgi:hypothetical protein
MHRGIILLEGADASGKSTIADFLIKHHNARYLHSTVRTDIWRWHLGALRYATRESDTRLVVMDRFHLSELIYGTIFRGGVAYGNAGLRSLDRVLRRFCCLTLLCVPGDAQGQEARWRSSREAGQEHFDRVTGVMDLYRSLTTNGFQDRDDVSIYDLDQHPQASLGPVVDGVLDDLARLRGTVPQGNLDHRRYNLSGRAEAGQSCVLLVGERVSPSSPPGWPRWPWVDSDQHLSAATWLNRAIDHLGLREDRLVFTNALEPDDHLPELLTQEWSAIVALGLEAEARLVNLGARGIRTIHHPQWHRRFRHPEGPAGYARLIEEAIT